MPREPHRKKRKYISNTQAAARDTSVKREDGVIEDRVGEVLMLDVIRADDAVRAIPPDPPKPEPPEPAPNETKRGMYSEILKAVANGESLDAAARKHGLAANIVSHDPLMRKMITNLLRSFRLPPDIRREVVRARLNQMLLEGDDRTALAAARQIAEDPEVGLRGGSQTVNIGIFSPEVAALIEGIPLSAEIAQSKQPRKIPKSITSDEDADNADATDNTTKQA